MAAACCAGVETAGDARHGNVLANGDVGHAAVSMPAPHGRAVSGRPLRRSPPRRRRRRRRAERRSRCSERTLLAAQTRAVADKGASARPDIYARSINVHVRPDVPVVRGGVASVPYALASKAPYTWDWDWDWDWEIEMYPQLVRAS